MAPKGNKDKAWSHAIIDKFSAAYANWLVILIHSLTLFDCGCFICQMAGSKP